MKHINYNTNRDLNELLTNAKGKYGFRAFLALFVISFLMFSNLPMEVILEESTIVFDTFCSFVVSFLGGYVSKEVKRSSAKKQLSSISEAMDKVNVHVLESDLERAVSTNIKSFDDRLLSDEEVINYFLVLDREKQIKILKSIKIDLSFERDRFKDNSLYVLDDKEMNEIKIPEEDKKRLVLGGNYGKVKL